MTDLAALRAAVARHDTARAEAHAEVMRIALDLGRTPG